MFFFEIIIEAKISMSLTNWPLENYMQLIKNVANYANESEIDFLFNI